MQHTHTHPTLRASPLPTQSPTSHQSRSIAKSRLRTRRALQPVPGKVPAAWRLCKPKPREGAALELSARRLCSGGAGDPCAAPKERPWGGTGCWRASACCGEAPSVFLRSASPPPLPPSADRSRAASPLAGSLARRGGDWGRPRAAHTPALHACRRNRAPASRAALRASLAERPQPSTPWRPEPPGVGAAGQATLLHAGERLLRKGTARTHALGASGGASRGGGRTPGAGESRFGHLPMLHDG